MPPYVYGEERHAFLTSSEQVLTGVKKSLCWANCVNSRVLRDYAEWGSGDAGVMIDDVWFEGPLAGTPVEETSWGSIKAMYQ